MNIEQYTNLPLEKQWWKKDTRIKEELNDVPLVDNNTDNIKNSDWVMLHEELAKTVIDFFKKHGCPKNGFLVSFDFDNIKDSVDFGEWTLGSDSSLCLFDENKENILSSM